MVKDWLSFRSCPSNPQACLIPSAAMELTLVKVSSMANVRRSSAAIFSFFIIIVEIKEEILSTRETSMEFWNDEIHSTLEHSCMRFPSSLID
jgi:hypothetical protein